MKRKLMFTQSPVSGDDMRIILILFPHLEYNFTRRKSYDEFYFEGENIEITLDKLEKLLDEYNLELSSEYITIFNN